MIPRDIDDEIGPLTIDIQERSEREQRYGVAPPRFPGITAGPEMASWAATSGGMTAGASSSRRTERVHTQSLMSSIKARCHASRSSDTARIAIRKDLR